MKTLVLRISGMHSECCIAQLTNNLKLVNGVTEVEADLLTRTACIEHDETLCNPRDLVAAVQGAGFQVDGFDPPEFMA